MKQWLKKNCLWLILGVALVAIPVFLYIRGFRITYAPELENDWDAISGCAAWAGVILSFVAILFAIWVPIKIARRQDKIALFEKRLSCYSEIQQILGCAELIKESTSVNDIFRSFCSVFGCLNLDSAQDAINQLVQTFNVKQLVLISGQFVFSKYDTEQATDLLHSATDLLKCLMDASAVPTFGKFPSEAKETRDAFCEKCEQFEKKYMDAMEAELNLR